MAVVLPTAEELEFKRKNLPNKPGCYLYKDANWTVIYVGKAKNLNKRVNSYWRENRNEDPIYVDKIRRLVASIRDLDIFVVENEAEALLLENELIKKYQPHFNAMLKDDKSFPWVMITNDKFPRISVIRGPERYGLHNKFLGPYVDAYDLRRLLRFTRKIFPYCTCRTCAQQTSRSRPCIYFQIKLCPAPCSGNISAEAYLDNIQGVEEILLGNIDPVKEILQKKMEEAAQNLDFETAVIFRDRLQALDKLIFNQSILNYNDLHDTQGNNSKGTQESGEISENIPLKTNLLEETQPDVVNSEDSNFISRLKDLDIIAGYFTNKRAGIIIIHVKQGRLLGKTPYIIDLHEKLTDENDYFSSFLEQYYLRSEIPLPDEIIIENPLPTEIQSGLEEYFVNKYQIPGTDHGKEITFRLPSEEDKTAGLMRIAKKNVELIVKQKEEYEQYLEDQHLSAEDQQEVSQGLQELHDVLELDDLPMIIEAFDISNIQGTDAVGSMVTFVEGKPSKAHYRKFKIRTKSTPDDFAMMRETVGRRYQRAVNEQQTLPDLIVIDGGKGQLNIAHQVLTDLGIPDIPHIGLAKREEEIFVPDKSESIILPKDSAGLHILQAIRDEAHRFAIQYHRVLRGKRQNKSELDEIPGVGPSRRTKLLQHFGDINEIRKASIEDIAFVVGSALATVIKEYFDNHPELNSNNQIVQDAIAKGASRRKKTSRKAVVDKIHKKDSGKEVNNPE